MTQTKDEKIEQASIAATLAKTAADAATAVAKTAADAAIEVAKSSISVGADIRYIQRDISDIKTSIVHMESSYDGRLSVLEKIGEQFPIEKLAKETHDNSEWRRDFQTRYKTVVTMAGLTGALVTFVLGLIAKVMGIIK